MVAADVTSRNVVKNTKKGNAVKNVPNVSVRKGIQVLDPKLPYYLTEKSPN